MSPATAIVFEGVTRRFGDHAAVDDVSLRVGQGELFGLVGPSGCGKTTLIRLIMGLLLPDEGEIAVRGKSPAAFEARDRQALGYMPQEFSLWPSLSMQQNCGFVAGLYGIGWWRRRKRIREVLDLLDLRDDRKTRAGAASGGQRRRLTLACALLHRPRLLVVDEPTAGLDPVLRQRIWEHLRRIQADGATVLVTTQLIEEAERCDSVGIMRAGRLVAHGSPQALRRRVDLAEVVEVDVDVLDRADVATVWALDGVRNARLAGPGRLRLEVDDAQSALPLVTSALAERGRTVRRADTREASFEEVFLELVEASSRDEERASTEATAQ